MIKRSLSKTERIIHEMGQQIISGKYIPGSGLSPEAELCEELSTSRNIIREVLRSLTAEQPIEIIRYRGAFVTARNKLNYLDGDVLQWVLACDYDPRLVASMIEVRNLVEPAIARCAAERATFSELAVGSSQRHDNQP